jgi:outer membrane protein
MRIHRNRSPFIRLAAVAIAASLLALPALADDYKIGVLHVERLLQQSKEAKAAHDRIEQEFKGRDEDIARKEQDVQAATAQLAKDRAALSPEAATSRERALELRTRDVQRLRQQFTEDLRARQFEELDKLKARLDSVLTQYAKDNHFDLILQDALYVGRSVDITDDVIKALEAK